MQVGTNERDFSARRRRWRAYDIIQVYDVGDHEGRPYFTMEFVEVVYMPLLSRKL
jgi:hypothetical protein